MAEQLHTYQDLAVRFRAHPKTIARWFRGRPKFCPTHNTVRIAESQVQAFIAEKSAQDESWTKFPPNGGHNLPETVSGRG